jgi:hypothetical protein
VTAAAVTAPAAAPVRREAAPTRQPVQSFPSASAGPAAAPDPGEAPASAPPAGDAPASNALASNALASDQTFRRISENWRQILNGVGQHSKQTQALLNSCKPFGMKEGTLFLGFNGDFARTKMEKGDNLDITRQVIAQLTGAEVSIRCFVASGGRNSIPPEVESDGMVAAALRDLGGEIVDVQ